MDQIDIPKTLLKWMEDFVEKPNPLLRNWSPCPYARQARIKDSIYIASGQNPISDGVSAVANRLWQKEVVIFYYDLNVWSYDNFTQTIAQLNEFLRPHGMISLEDHPDDTEDVNGVVMNFGPAALSIIQETKKLNDAAELLYQKGYYSGWSQEYFDKVFTNRQAPNANVHGIRQN